METLTQSGEGKTDLLTEVPIQMHEERTGEF